MPELTDPGPFIFYTPNSTTIKIGPDTDFVRLLVSQYDASANITFQLVNSSKKAIWVEQKNDDYHLTTPFEYIPKLTEALLRVDGIDILYQEANVTIDTFYFAGYALKAYASGLLFIAPVLVLLAVDAMNFSQLRQENAFFLIRLSGAFMSTANASFLLIDLIVLIVASLLWSILAYAFDFFSKECDFSLLFVTAMVTSLATAFQMYSITPFRFKAGQSVVLYFLLLAATTLLIFLTPGTVTTAWPSSLLRLIFIVLPSVSFGFVLVDLSYSSFFAHCSWSNSFTPSIFLSSGELVLCACSSLFIYAFLFVVIIVLLDSWNRPMTSRAVNSLNHPVAIEVDDLSKRYGSLVAVDSASFQINKGDIVVLIGPNGSGKSSLINSLIGLTRADTGSLMLYGQPAKFSSIQGMLGVCLQDDIFVPMMTAREHLQLFGELRGLSQEICKSQVELFASILDLHDILDMETHHLSGGQQRKLCVAMAYIGSPPIVVLDEPTRGVDGHSRSLIWKILNQMTNTTTLISTHSLEESEAIASKLFLLGHGHLLFQGSIAELRETHQTGYFLTFSGQGVRTEDVLDIMNRNDVSEAKVHPFRHDTLILPMKDEVLNGLEEIEARQSELNIDSFTLVAESLESVLLAVVQGYGD